MAAPLEPLNVGGGRATVLVTDPNRRVDVDSPRPVHDDADVPWRAELLHCPQRGDAQAWVAEFRFGLGHAIGQPAMVMVLELQLNGGDTGLR